MDKLTSTERLIRTFKGEEIDRIATYDIIHNIDLIEYLTGQKVTPKNAEDLLCKAASSCLDLIRHFAVPDYEGTKVVKEEDGYVYRYEWWTGHIMEKPVYRTVEDIVRKIEEDIEKIQDCTKERKICSAANNHVNLFYEKFEYFEEVKEEYRRITNKLDGTVMLGPEMCQGVSIGLFRYGIDSWAFLYHDYPEVAIRYIDSLYDYEIAFIESYADMDIMPICCSAGSVGMDDRLFFPYEFYKEVIIPREKRVTETFKKYGKFVIHFLDGYKWPVVGDFINIGTDAVDPFEPYCDMDVKRFREMYDNTVICQPIDCTQLLPYGSEEEIKDAVIKAIEDADKRKILIGSTSEIHPAVNYRNAITMYETARNYKL